MVTEAGIRAVIDTSIGSLRLNVVLANLKPKVRLQYEKGGKD